MPDIYGLKGNMVMKMIVNDQSRLLGPVLVLVLIATYFISTPAFAQSNITSVVGISVYPTINCIGVQSTYTGDDNNNNSAVLEYRKAGDTAWLTGLPMAMVYGQKIWAGSIIGLAGNAGYDVRVTFTDSDGVSGTNPVIGMATTRPDTYTPSSVHTYYVDSTSGLDTNSGDTSHPWKTIQHAADKVVAGDMVRIRAGTYHERVNVWQKSGVSYTAMITFIADDSANKPLINGSDLTIETNAGGNIWTAVGDGSYYTTYAFNPYYVAVNDTRLYMYQSSATWTARGTGAFVGITYGYWWDASTDRLYVDCNDINPNTLTMHVDAYSNTYSQYDSAFMLYGSDYINIKDIEIAYFHFGIAIYPEEGSPYKRSSYGIVDDCYIHHVAFGVFMFSPRGNTNPTVDWLIEDNTFYDNGPSTWPWGVVKSATYGNYGEGTGVMCWYNGQGLVVRRNNSNGMFDGFASGDYTDGWVQGTSNYIRDMDFYENTSYYHGDDGLTLTGTNINTRIWSNTIYNSLTGISSAPVILGPCYVYRNVIYRLNGAGSGVTDYYPYKLGHAQAQGKTFYYHNTVYDATNSGRLVNGWTDQDAPNDPGYNIVAKNNILVVTRKAITLYNVHTGLCEFDYNNLWTNYSVFANWDSGGYSTWALFKTGTGQEAHGLNTNGATSKFVNATNGDFQLQSSSPLIDVGVVIPNMNGANSPWPYSGSAPDIGAFEYASNMPPPLGADFSASPTQGIAGVTQFIFTDGSSGGAPPCTYQWDFDNNGTWDSTAQNPTYAYSTSGSYTVTLKVTDAAGNTNTKSKTGYIAVYKLGDANQDGNINSLDVTKVKRIIVGLDSPTPGADANGDGNVNALDITRIELIIAGY
jgi:PKD repeat protein